MSHKSRPPHRSAWSLARCLGWTCVAMVLSTGSAGAAPPVPPTPTQTVTRVANAQTDPDTATRRLPAQTVSDALGQRLDRMLIDSKPPPTR
jgi:hypothetical protein